MSHTPGPWSVSTAEGMDNGCVVMGANDRMICEAFEDGETQTDEDKSNARLIAAAPDLLAACLLYRTTYDETDHHPTRTEESQCMNAMRAAIAKATEAA